MDFIVLSTLMGAIPVPLTLSYDIICQYSRNFKKRVSQFPSEMQLSTDLLDSIKFVIPKFHIYGHGRQCQTKFSLNYLPYSARTNGEEPERSHLSVDYVRYYWSWRSGLNHDITGSTNLGPYMQFYWMGQDHIKYSMLLNGLTTYNHHITGMSPGALDQICNIAGWAHHTQYAILLGGPTVCNM